MSAIQTPTSPQSPVAEKGIISSFLLSPMEIGSLCAERCISSSHFYLPSHALIFGALTEMWREGLSIDIVTLTQFLDDKGQLDSAGGAALVTELFTYLPTHTNARNYLDIVQEKHILREIIKVCSEFSARSYEEQDDVAGLLSEANARIASVGAVKAISRPKTPKELAIEAGERAEDRIIKRGLPDNVMQTGIAAIDEAMSGIREGDFVLISGKEKSGKTSLAFNIFENVVFNQQKRALVVSLEMKTPEIVDRLIAQMGRINLTRILNGWMENGETDKFNVTAIKIAGGKFIFRDDLFNLSQIVAVIRQHKAENPDLALVMVDYLQLIDGEKKRDKNRESEIAENSRTLRRLAGELNLGMIVLVQLNEDGQVRESRSPGMDCTAHIRIEPGDKEGLKWARIVYQRNGPSNVGVPLAHIGQFLRFEQAALDTTPTQEPRQHPKTRNRYEE